MYNSAAEGPMRLKRILFLAYTGKTAAAPASSNAIFIVMEISSTDLQPHPVPQNRRPRDLRNLRRAALAHGQGQLRAQNVEHAFDALLAEGGEPVDVGSANSHGARSDREGFIDVRAPAKAAVHQHRDLAAHGV